MVIHGRWQGTTHLSNPREEEDQRELNTSYGNDSITEWRRETPKSRRPGGHGSNKVNGDFV